MNKTMSVVYKVLFVSAFSLISLSALADFDIKGEVKMVYPTGAKESSKMSIGYVAKEYDHTFKIGKAEYAVSGRPDKYSFVLVLQKNNYVWVQEFSKSLIESFDWKIGEKHIRLYKEILAKPVMGDYILSIDDKDYFFSKNIAQITFSFNEEGLEEIEVDGMVASLGLNKVKAECKANENEEASGEPCESPEG
ncbi:hypothetical protein Q4575_00530 [Psychrosphaera sp. 1_MG-2023]|uniref:hypothetical protein n=1 Tax=Psychrosphaera sp. 1_MG-2023 TaxID=3062643 RepID=UPI0026E377DA|nr:hypothetical protein [Psychrosphaera sp. 1_MG-2023]MDO6717863.1 hypothetical protein [Psychrosphaera sp. 1_MG-2023]